MSQPSPFRRIYGPAAILAAVTFYGLLSALLGDGIWDTASWCALSIPLAVIVWKWGQSRSTKFTEGTIRQSRRQKSNDCDLTEVTQLANGRRSERLQDL